MNIYLIHILNSFMDFTEMHCFVFVSFFHVWVLILQV